MAFHGAAQAFGAPLGIFGADSAQEQYEFFAAVTGEQVGFAFFVFQDSGDFLEHHITALVPPGVVHLFEMVCVHHDRVDVEVVAAGERQFAEPAVEERAPVGNPCERVHRSRFEKLAVKSFFACILEVDFQDHLANLQAVVVFEFAVVYRGTVNEGAVGASQVLDGHVDAVKGQGAVPAAYQFVIQADVRILPTAQHHSPFFQGNLLE